MRLDHLLAALPQLLSMYLIFCVLANWLSILAPMPVAAGTLKPPHLRAVPLLLHLAFLFLFPLALAPTLLPLGVEAALHELGWARAVPLCLPLSLAECAALVFLYRLALTWQGGVLQAREQKILETVATRAE